MQHNFLNRSKWQHAIPKKIWSQNKMSQNKYEIQFGLLICCLISIFSGCMGWNQYQTTMMQPSVEIIKNKLKLNIIHTVFTVEKHEEVNEKMGIMYSKKFNKDELMSVAQKLYPDLFTKDDSALPIKIDVQVKYEYSDSSLSTLNLCTVIPQCIDKNDHSTLSLYVREAMNESDQYVKYINKTEYDFKTRHALALLSPTSFFIPSLPDVSKKDYYFLNYTIPQNLYKQSQQEAIIHAIIQSIIDGNKYEDLAILYEQRSLKIQQKKIQFAGGTFSKSDQSLSSWPVNQSAYRKTKKYEQIGNFWAVVIGISTYQYTDKNGLTNLIFADDDARAFARALQNLDWPDSHIKLLINQDATERNVKIALESWLTKAGPNDQIILFWAGHGFPDPEDPEKVYFACYDTDINIPATGYRMDKVRQALEEKNARNVVLFADTCHAGKLITRGQGDRGISIIPNIKQQNIPKGWVFMVGADTDRQAIEHASWTNGAFTHSLLKGLNGEADGFQSAGPKDGIVTMGELKSYMNTSMPDETQRVLGVAKRPVITTSTGDPDIWHLTLQPGN